MSSLFVALLLAAAPDICVLARASDGDSLVCADGRRVRLLLIDAPERGQGAVAEASKRALLALAPKGTKLRIEHDVEVQDRHRRTLAYLWLPDGRMLNEALARGGHVTSLTYPPNVKHVERIRAAIEEAKNAKRGIWRPGALACEPRTFRQGRCRR